MQKLRFVMAFACAALTAACGGGDGPTMGGNGPSMLTIESLQGADPDGTRMAAARVADNLPNFGSLTQSSNVGSDPGVTGDVASVAFDGQNLDLTVRRQDRSSLRLNTADHALGSDPGTGSGILGHDRSRFDVMAQLADNVVSSAITYVSWSNGDPLDYLAGGYWIHREFEGDREPVTITRTEIGAFVDGPELDGPASLPVSGTATYQGATRGFYAESRDAETEIGDFTAFIELTADFGSNAISGCVGCIVPIMLTSSENESSESETTLRLGSADIETDGSFRNQAVRLVTPGVTYTANSGSWGGKFSNVPDPAGDPRLVAGTYGAKAETAGGAGITFVGTYHANKSEQ